MAKRTFTAGATSQTIDVFIQDTTKTDGSGLAGLVFNSSGLKCYYRKGATGTATAVTLATQTVGGAWSSGGFVEIDATNMKGVYRFDVPDTVLASAPWATLYFYGATSMAPNVAELEILTSAPLTTSDIPTANANADALLDRANGIETGVTPRGLWRLIGAVLGGKLSGAGTGMEAFRNTVADSKNRIVATVDSNGNRTAITTDMT